MKQETATVIFRGKPVDVVYEDMGPEPGCNAHVIEWHFLHDPCDLVIPLNDFEEQSIYDQLYDQLKEWVDMTPDGWA